ncbi:MAG: aminotransferase class I/II-fold pyridoxal phosphate-dependent enzyme [Oscillospiraceae bacterium]
MGRVWRREELERLLDICQKHRVTVVSDEIHQDITHEGAVHIPLCSLKAENTMLLTSPSKTFNLAGFQNALAVIPDHTLRERWDAFTQPLHMSFGNTLGYVAGEAAYRDGAEWNRTVCRQVYANYAFLREKLLSAYPRLRIPALEGTYLMWIDFGAYLKEEEIQPFFQEKCGLALNYGSAFGGHSGTCVRINLATGAELVSQCADRILAALAQTGAG